LAHGTVRISYKIKKIACFLFLLSISLNLCAIMKLLSLFMISSCVYAVPTYTNMQCVDDYDCNEGQRCSSSLDYTSTCVSATKLAGINELCQGSTHVGCSEGLYCSHSTELEQEFGAGVCLKAKRHGTKVLGSLCGGFTGAACKDGLECKLFEGHEDSEGLCYDTKATLHPLGGMALGGLCGGPENVSCGPTLQCASPRPHIHNSLGVCISHAATE